jgi:hypothetical protein
MLEVILIGIHPSLEALYIPINQVSIGNNGLEEKRNPKVPYSMIYKIEAAESSVGILTGYMTHNESEYNWESFRYSLSRMLEGRSEQALRKARQGRTREAYLIDFRHMIAPHTAHMSWTYTLPRTDLEKGDVRSARSAHVTIRLLLLRIPGIENIVRSQLPSSPSSIKWWI